MKTILQKYKSLSNKRARVIKALEKAKSTLGALRVQKEDHKDALHCAHNSLYKDTTERNQQTVDFWTNKYFETKTLVYNQFNLIRSLKRKLKEINDETSNLLRK